MNATVEKLRLRAAWLAVPFYVWLARPTATLLVAGGAVALLGVAIRGWAAGTIKKSRVLSTGGPYALSRNPLYLGTLVIGIGLTVASGRWSLVVLFLLFFAVLYQRTIRKEEAFLEEQFGERYRRYRAQVPRLIPRPRVRRALTREELVAGGNRSRGTAAYGDGSAASDEESWARGRFSVQRYRANREYQALIGVLAMLLVLAAKLVLR